MRYYLKSGIAAMNFDDVTDMLATAFWAPGISKAEVCQGATNSAYLAGAFTPRGRQIGFARAISDKTRFAYILDVIVAAGHRRQGIGKALITKF